MEKIKKNTDSNLFIYLRLKSRIPVPTIRLLLKNNRYKNYDFISSKEKHTIISLLLKNNIYEKIKLT